MLFLPIPSNHRVWSRFNFQLRLAHFLEIYHGLHGRRAELEATERPRINIVLNWFEELKERVPVL